MAKKNYDLKLKGYVGGWDFDANYVEYILNKCGDREVNVCIDSLGGNVSTALSVSALFKNHGKVNVHYIGMNASAATIASMGAAHVSMDKNAMYLVHKCSDVIFECDLMNADQLKAHIDELKKTCNDLEKIDANIASLYADRCKKTPEELMNLMKVGGWLNAQEALEWGFVDEISEDEDEKAPTLAQETITAMAAAGIPIPEQANEQREQAKKNLMAAFQQLFGFQPVQSVAEPETKEPDTKEDTKPLTTEGHQDPVNSNTPMKKIFSFIALAIACAVQEFEANADGKFAFDETQMDALEATLKANAEAKEAADKQIADLQKQVTDLQASVKEKDEAIAALNAAPGADPTHVNSDHNDEPEDNAWTRAEKMFKGEL